jgi:hypothetical protein
MKGLLGGKNWRCEKRNISTSDTVALLLLTNRVKTATSTIQYRATNRIKYTTAGKSNFAFPYGTGQK